MDLVLYIYQTITYCSFRLAKVVALSFGFFALMAAFFWALSRSCSRWFPPRAPRDFDGEPTENLKEGYDVLISSRTYESLVVYDVDVYGYTAKDGFETVLTCDVTQNLNRSKSGF